MMRTLARFVTRFPKTIIAVVLLATVFFGWAAARIERRVDLEGNLPESDPRIAAYKEISDKYTSGNGVFVVLEGTDVFTTESLRAVDRISQSLLTLEGVRRVTSLTNLTEFRSEGDALRSGPLVAQVPETPEELEALRRKVMSDRWYRGQLVSDDGRCTIIVADFKQFDTIDEGVVWLNRVRDLVEKEKGALTAHYAGPTVMDAEIDRFLGADLALLFPVVLGLILVILFWTFRNTRGVLLPFATVLMSVVWTLGTMALLRRPLSMVSNILPVLLIGVGSAYGIHIVARYQEGLAKGLDPAQAVQAAVTHTGFGVWMAALTTIAGFGSLALSKLKMIFDFGVFSAFGVLVAFLISITFIPAILMLLPARRPRAAKGGKATGAQRTGDATGKVERFLAGLAKAAVARHGLVVLAGGLVLVLSLAGWSRVVTSFSPSDFLPKGSGPRQAENLVDAKFGGSASIEVLVKGDLNDLRLLRAMERYQAEMERLGTGRPMSVVNLLSRINRAFNGGDPQFEALPDDPEAIPQYLFLLTISTKPEELAEFISFDQKEARISTRVSNLLNTAERSRLVTALQEKAREVFGPAVPVTVTGAPVMEMAMMDLIRDEQVQNIASSLVAVLLLVVVAFRSLATGLVIIAPIVLTVLANLGVMGWFGIHLDVATAIISSLATGIGIDYSIHFYRRYQEERQGGRPAEEALVETSRTTGAAIVSNAVAVGAGFGILLLSQFNMFRAFGGLIALTMVFASTGALTLVPALEKLHLGWSGRAKSAPAVEGGGRLTR